MPFTITNLTQPSCLTIIYNLSSRLLVDSFIDCGGCKLETELNPTTKDLTIRVPIVLQGQVTFADNLQSGCVTTGVSLGETEQS